MSRLARFLFTAALPALAAHAASDALAQTGQFVPSESYFSAPFGGSGVGIFSGQIWVDVNGSGLQEPGVDTYHPIPGGFASGWDFRLTPSRRVMVAFTSNGSVCPGTPTSIRLFSIPLTNGANLVPLGSQQALPGCIEDVGFFDDPTGPLGVGYFRGPADLSGHADILWWDLSSGEAAPSPSPYASGFGLVEFAPHGTMAWVQHTISTGAGTSAFSIVTLCPGFIGQASQPGLTNQPDVLHAHVEDAGGNLVVVARTSGGTQVASFNYTDCALPPPVTGACCLPGGGCLGGTTEPECETTRLGTWQGPATSCTPSPCPPPPAPALEIWKDGPLDVERGTVFLYTLHVSNSGTASATNVTVLDSLPALMSFEFAMNGGAFDPATRRVTWNLGTLGAGSAKALTLGVRAPCSGSSVVNDTYRVTADVVGSVAGTPVVTTLNPANTTPLTISLSSLALAPTPLQSGNRVRHTVQLTNTLSDPRPGVRLTFQGGEFSSVVAITDSGGGSVVPIGAQFQWEVSLEPLETTQLVWETEIKECRPSAPATERINRTGVVTVATRCGQFLGFGMTAQTISIAGSPFALRLDTTNPGPAQATPSSWITVARPGASLDFELRFLHVGTAPAPHCSMAVQIPMSMTPVGDPPWIGTPPPGTTWDPGLRVVGWSGQPGSNDSVTVRFRAALGSEGCLDNLLAVGGYGACANQLSQSLGVVGVPEPPPGAHLVGLDPANGLWTYIPGAGQWKPLLCGAIGNSAGVGRAPDGTLWVAGTPTYRIHPGTLDFQVYPASFNATLGMDFPGDCDADPRDSSMVFVGYQSGIGLRVRRWDPATSTASFILNDLSPMTFGPGNSVAVEADGWIGVQTGSHLLRIDPANPPAYVNWSASGQSAQGFGGICLDTDGDYLVPEAGPTTRRLYKVDPGSGAFAVITDLDPAFTPGGTLSGGVVTLPDLRAYVASFGGEMVELQRANGNATVSRPGLTTFTDLLYVDGPTVDAPPPGADAAPAALLLRSAAPNPFSRGTTLRFALPRAGMAALEVFDLSGRRVRALAGGRFPAGEHAVTWDARGEAGERLPAGLYFVRLALDGESRTGRVVLSP